MNIGQLSQVSETQAQTIRYYEQIGLLSKPKRTPSNYRVYEEIAVKRLLFIKRAKQIGFSLKDIKMLMAMSDGKTRNCKKVSSFVQDKLDSVREQIMHLHAIEGTLQKMATECRQNKVLSDCPILDLLTAEPVGQGDVR